VDEVEQDHEQDSSHGLSRVIIRVLAQQRLQYLFPTNLAITDKALDFDRAITQKFDSQRSPGTVANTIIASSRWDASV